jgi:hypothetical protein
MIRGSSIVLVLFALVLPGVAAAQPSGIDSPPVPQHTLSFGVAYEYSNLDETWSTGNTVGPEKLNADLLASSPAFHVVRGWIGRRRWMGPDFAGEGLLSLGIGHSFERRQNLTGSLGTYALDSSFNLVDLEAVARFFMVRQIVFVELGFIWQRVFPSAHVADGNGFAGSLRSQDDMGGLVGAGVEFQAAKGLRLGFSLGAAGFLKIGGPYPTRSHAGIHVGF